MAPTRKSRSVNNRFSYVNESSPNKDGDAKKSMQRKRKLSDMLGSQWSKAELERFYEAYRKYGTDWKKVVAVVRNRSVEMVEALYTMNKAYLSLPEGTASVVGLIAMMTDHYSNLEGSDSEIESNEGIGTSQKSQKRVRSKFQPNTSIGSDGHFVSHSQPVASSSGFLLLSKKKRSVGSRARAVGKRTPRFPVSYSYEKVNGEKFFSATRQGLKLKVDANDDDVAHVVALALAEASQKGGSPQVSQTPNRRTPIRSGERRRAELELTSAKIGSEGDEDGFEGSIGSMEADNGDYARQRNDLRQSEVGTTEGRKGRRLYGKKLEVIDSGNSRLDDIKEACSGTEGQIIGTVRGKLEFEVTDGKVARSTSQVSRKKSKKFLFGRDEGSAFDALQTLANLSLMMPATSVDNESSVQVNDDDDDHLVDRYELLKTVSVSQQRDMVKSSGVKAKDNELLLGFRASTKTSKIGKASAHDASGNPEAKEELHQSTAKLLRKKQKMSSKIPKTEAHTDDTYPIESHDAEARDAGKKLMSKSKRSGSNSSQKKQGKSVKHPELSSSTDLRGEKDDSSQSLVQVPVTNQVNLPTKVRSRRKMELQKPQNLNDVKFSDKFLDDHRSNLPFSSVQDGSLDVREKLSNCLSNDRLRRWCAFEWFYSAVDYPWFAKREFVEYLNHVGLGHVPRLTRVEWGVIRSSLGKPRRFSEQFLKEEKEKLNQYRDSVRTHYTELREGTREGLPTDLARPLSVGQRVIAIHPRTREVHDGNVLTVDHSRCRIQFDRPELGVEFVLDVDCMPLNPSENMPASLAMNPVTIDKLFENFNELKMNGWAKDQKLEGLVKAFPPESLEHVDVSNLLKHAKVSPTNPNSQAKNGPNETANNKKAANSHPSILAPIEAKEADVQALAELTRALDKKEAVVSELRHMNDDVLENQKDGDNTLKDREPFKKQYAAILVRLNEMNDQVSSALYCLRQRNTYQGNSQHTRLRTTENVGDLGGPVSLFDQPENHPQESGPHVHEIVESSRTKARTMVDAAMQAGGNSFDRIADAIDYVSNRLSLDDSSLLAMRHTSADTLRGNSASHDPLASCCSSNSLHATGPELKNALDRNEAQIPSELISHCVATLLMIQKCTEREFPPADVAVILDSAVTSLQPCCSQNLPVYAEIQKCMGIIKNQILALVPT